MNHASEIVQHLRLLPCLSCLSDEDIAVIEQTVRLKRFRKGEVIFEESAHAKYFYVVMTGSVKLYKISNEGRELIIKVIKEGDYFCHAPICSGSGHFVNAMAIEDSTLIEIPAVDFKRILKSMVSDVGWRIISCLCARIRYLSALVEDLAFKDVEQRVILALWRLTEKMPFNIVTLKVTHQDIASIAGTVKEVVSRTMLKLKKEGVIFDTSARGFKVNKEMLLKLLKRKTSDSSRE